MARSFRTAVPRVAAQRRIRREPDGAVVLPKILVRKPARGDIHAIPSAALQRILHSEVPLEYLHGLRRIEMHARTGVVGDPFAYYLRAEKTIILYSLPLEWSWSFLPRVELVGKMQQFFAQISVEPEKVRVRWPGREVLMLWFFVEVVAHELGHHYRNQYRIRRGSGRARRHEEFVADLHSARFFDAFRRKLRSRGRPQST